MVLEAAVALFSLFREPVPACRPVKQGLRLVAQAVVHPVLKGEGQVLQAAGAPEVGLHGGGGGGHDAALVRTLAGLRVVVHSKVVAHLVRHGGGHQPDHLAVPHAHAARELKGTDGTF